MPNVLFSKSVDGVRISDVVFEDEMACTDLERDIKIVTCKNSQLQRIKSNAHLLVILLSKD